MSIETVDSLRKEAWALMQKNPITREDRDAFARINERIEGHLSRGTPPPREQPGAGYPGHEEHQRRNASELPGSGSTIHPSGAISKISSATEKTTTRSIAT